MNASPPLVSIVTPVYNGEKYLLECIESVLGQSYEHWEYIIADNSSTDRTRHIAEECAKRDARISVHRFEDHVGVIRSHNRCLRLISPRSKYCKVVSADDLLFPECVARMVEVAEAHPTIGIVGAYRLTGSRITLDGLPYPSTFVPGRNICRWHLLNKPFVFGAPSSVMYRADLVRGAGDFYPHEGQHADTSACYLYLQNSDFGFVHQVLSFERLHDAQLSRGAIGINSYISSVLEDLLRYGPVYLTGDELERRRREVLDEFYYVLARSAYHFRGKMFWAYQKERLRQLGHPFSSVRFLGAVCQQAFDLALNPKHTLEKAARRLRSMHRAPAADRDCDVLATGI
jgi:glycosyltransferase involved in cell wall biosynthesis